jgi:hypothetical protein
MKLSQLIREASQDAQELLTSGTHQLDMDDWVSSRMTFNNSANMICSVCLAGAYLVSRVNSSLKTSQGFNIYLGSLSGQDQGDLRKKLDALDLVRKGILKGAYYSYYNPENSNLLEPEEHSKQVYFVGVIDQDEQSQFFKQLEERAVIIEAWERKYL